VELAENSCIINHKEISQILADAEELEDGSARSVKQRRSLI